ncbi:SusF/SusE family outer membrane protein [Neolewinella aurantiaca]|uniref:SusF/SusE family outer membrane protein n=1 Tax=Neolewinella aurantiaca TaxID=2602767 RepID=A0A5C7F7N6_9BACT|nr:SusE domain-containing protein [Neolewinella aurantiaca]TXF86692.1 SusF/SusE family outer membrane protein [Neolewinella aurantiaca]
MLKQHFIFAFAAILLSFTACEEESFDPVLTLGAPSSISAPADGSSFIIEESTREDDFPTFTWSAADFGFPAGARYSVEVALAGTDFAEPTSIIPAVNALSGTAKNSTINNFLINNGIAGGTSQAVEVRIKASVGTTADNNVLYSSPISLNVTPFEAEIEYPKIYVPGAHQGWSPDAPDAPRLHSVEDNGIYDGYVFFAEANNQFKFTPQPNWDADYGDTGADGTLDAGGDNIMAGEAGLYRLNANINDLTYTATVTNWGLIGSATPTGWDSDTDLVYDAETGLLSLTIDLVEGEIKFRANDAWDLDFGDVGADLKLEYGGDNIVVAEGGNYTIVVDLTGPIYSYSLTKN